MHTRTWTVDLAYQLLDVTAGDIEAVVVVAVILLNAGFAFVQEQQAERALRRRAATPAAVEEKPSCESVTS